MEPSTLGFLTNPLNTAIVAGCVVFVVVAVLYVLRGKSLSIGKDGVSIGTMNDRRMSDAVPKLDAEIKAACREALTSNRKAVLGKLKGDKMRAMAIEAQLIDVMFDRIRENDLIEKFTDKVILQHWIERCVDETIARIAFVENYTDTKIVCEELQGTLTAIIEMLYKMFYDNVVKGVKEKIKYYQSLNKSDKTEELIERNKKYVDALKHVRDEVIYGSRA